MAYTPINLGSVADDLRGDRLRTAGQKLNSNFAEVYASHPREIVTSSRTYYVSTSGNDSNTGLTVGSPFLTIQKAVQVATESLVVYAGLTITIQLADGTYTLTAPINLGTRWGNTPSPRNLVFNGNATTPANVVVTSSTVSLFQVYSGFITIQNMELRCTFSSGACVMAERSGRAEIGIGMRFGTSTGSIHLFAAYGGLISGTTQVYTLAGSALRHHYALYNGTVDLQSKPVTISGTPALSIFAEASLQGSINLFGATFTGSATGTRYSASLNGVIVANNTLPGTGGSVATGGYFTTSKTAEV